MQGSVEQGVQFLFGDALLFGCVAIAESDGAVFFDGIEIDGNTPRRSDFVHAAITSADGTGGIPERIVPLLEFFVDPVRTFDEFGLVLEQW